MRILKNGQLFTKCSRLLLVCAFASKIAIAQTPGTNIYPKVVGYASVLHPIVTFDKDGSSFNFNGRYTVGFPFGINILKSDNIGFSFELAPTIRMIQPSVSVALTRAVPILILLKEQA